MINNNLKIIIAIDGGAATGKTSIAKELAKSLKYEVINSGIYYRYVSWYMLNKKIENIKELVNHIKMNFLVFPNNLNISKYNNFLIDLEITKNLGKITKIKEIRNFINNQIKNYVKSSSKNFVVEGRDIGTIVFPKAQLKFFLVVDPQIAIQRRKNQLIQQMEYKIENQTNNSFIKDVEETIIKRNEDDSLRKIAPLIQAKDAILINTSFKTIEEILKEMKLFFTKLNLDIYCEK